MDLISGKWVGEFVYGRGYDDKRGKKVQFFMTLFYDGNTIRGTSVDDEARNIFREPARIEGSFDNNVLIFYLTYSMESVIGVKKNAENYSANSIQYIGVLKRKFFAKEYYFKGTWDINESQLNDNGETYHFSGNGTWKMKRMK